MTTLPEGLTPIAQQQEGLPAGLTPIEQKPSDPVLGISVGADMGYSPEVSAQIDNVLGPRRSASERVVKAATDAVGTLFSGDFGWTDKDLGATVEQEENDPLALLKSFNRVLVQGGSAAVDVTMRAGFAPFIGGIAAVGQAAREFGMDDTGARRLERDLMAWVVSGLTALGFKSPSPAAFRSYARGKIVDEVPPAGRGAVADALDAGLAAGEREAGTVPPSIAALTEPRIVQPVSKHVVDAAEDILIAGNVTRAEGRLLSDQIMELLQTRRLSTEQIGEILTRHNLTPDAFAELWRVNIRKAAQDMQTLSAVEQRLKALSARAGAEGELAALQEAQGLGADARQLNWWRRVDNVRRGLMVTQLATAMRNFETQMGRVGLDTLQQGMDAGLARMFGKDPVHPVDAFGVWSNVLRRSATETKVDEVLAAFPVEADKLMTNWLSEFHTGAFGKVEGAVQLLNTANRFQEFVVRRAVFASRLDQHLRAEGSSLDDIIARNAIGEIPRDAVRAAVEHSLEMTFGKNFSPFDAGAAGLAGSVIQTVNRLPGATFAIPFPRFMMNAIKFQYEWSPFGYLRLLSPTERAAISNGDFSAISRATIGTGMLLAAHQFRTSEYAGEKWYEAKLPDGRTLDLRPFNPFASYLFVADIAKRKNDGTLVDLKPGEVINGILAMQMRAGTGAFMLDQLLDGIAGLEPSEKGVRAFKEFAGNVLAGFAVPFAMVGDFIAEFDKSQAIVRSGKEDGVLGPVKRIIPFLKDDLPPIQNPLRADTTVREEPYLRQLTGLSVGMAKNPVEREVDRLGIDRKEYFPTTGDPAADRMIAATMGPIVAQVLPALVESSEYKAMQPAVQAFYLLKAIKGVQEKAKDKVQAEHPALAARMKLEAIPKRERRMLDAISGGKIKEAIDMFRQAEGEK